MDGDGKKEEGGEEEDRKEERKGTYCLIERMIVGLFLEYKDNFLEGRHEREGGRGEGRWREWEW